MALTLGDRFDGNELHRVLPRGVVSDGGNGCDLFAYGFLHTIRPIA